MKAPIRDSAINSSTNLRRSNANLANNNNNNNNNNSSVSHSSFGNNNNSNSNISNGNCAEKTYIKVYYGDNSLMLVNTLCSCLHMLNFIKEQLRLNKDESIDLMDFDGALKEMPNVNNKDYAIQFVNPALNYAVIKTEFDSSSSEKRFNCLLSESRQTQNMIKSLSALNVGKTMSQKDKANLMRQSKLKQQQLEKSSSQANINNANGTNSSSLNLNLEKQPSGLSLNNSNNNSSNGQTSSALTTGRKSKAK